MEIDLIAWGSRPYEQPVASQRVKYSVPALGSKVVKTLPLKPLLSNESLTLNDAIVQLSTAAVGNARGKNFTTDVMPLRVLTNLDLHLVSKANASINYSSIACEKLAKLPAMPPKAQHIPS